MLVHEMNEFRRTNQKCVAAIILNWNGCKDTLECLDSLYKCKWDNLKVFVADNGSQDNSVAEIRSKFPACKVLELGLNFGFAEGNNRAVAAALEEGCDFLLLLNNDTTVEPDLIEKLVFHYQKLGPRSVLGAKIAYYDDPKYIWDFGALWDKSHGTYHKVAKDQLMQGVCHVVEVDHIIGCTMFIPADLVREIGLFDKRFFLNYEETDWCVRAKAADIKLYSIPDAIVYHKISRSFQGSLHNHYFLRRNRALWLQNFTWKERMRWFWLGGRFKANLLATMKTLVALITLPVWVGVARWRVKKFYRMAESLVRFVAFFHCLIGRYGDSPEWVRKLSKIVNIKRS